MSNEIYVNDHPVELCELARIDPEKIRILWASDCTALTMLPDLPKCRALYISGCTGLNALPDLPACRIIDASGCTGLGVIDAGEDSRGYDFRGVPLRSGWRILVEKIAAEIAKREMQQ